jgi:hypothetical protein
MAHVEAGQRLAQLDAVRCREQQAPAPRLDVAPRQALMRGTPRASVVICASWAETRCPSPG